MNDEINLIRRAQTGDDAAFCALVEIHARRVHRLAWRFCRNAADAEDLSQEVWLKAHKSLKSFRFEAQFYTWLRQILVRTFLSYKSKVQTAEINESDFAENDFAETASRKILADRVRVALAEMTAQQRLIFLLKHEEGMTYEEIAALLDCSSGTIKKSLFRTVKKLRQLLGVNGSTTFSIQL